MKKVNEVIESEEKVVQKKKNNKGFSLVELIIVIAIMAILVGIIGSQVVPYLEKSRVSKDMTTLDTCYTSLQTVVAEKAPSDFANKKLSDLDATIKTELISLIGNGVIDDATLKNKLVSKNAKGKDVLFSYSAGVIKVSTGTTTTDLFVSNTGTSADAPVPTATPAP